MKKSHQAKIQKYMSLGINHYHSGNFREATMNFRKILKLDPRNLDAKNVMGAISLAIGDAEKAVDLFKSILAQDNTNSSFMNNLGQALHATGDVKQAISYYRQALDFQPNNTDYLNNLSISLNHLAQCDEAETVYQKAISLNSQDPELRHNFGIMLQEMGEYTRAIESYQSALSLNPSLPLTLGSLASAFESIGQREQAMNCYYDAIKLSPLYLAAHDGIKKIHWAAREFEKLHASYHFAIKLLPNSAEAYCNLARSLLDSQEYQPALDAVKIAIDLNKNYAPSYTVMSNLHREQHKYELSIEAHEKVLELNGADAQAYEDYGYTLSIAKMFKEAASKLLKAHKMNPRRSSVLGGLTVAMNEVDDPKVKNYLDYDKYVTARPVAVPEGFEDLHAFNDALHDEISARHDNRPPPMGQTMRGGTQIPDHLFKGETGLTAVVKQLISNELSKYIQTLDTNQKHPFLRFKNPDFRFTGAWSTILHGAGYDGSHIHNDGWLSGVYYVKTPDLPEEIWDQGEGCIQFGAPPNEFVSDKNQPHKLIRPTVGTTVFFPSYYWHGVQPFKQEGLRHSIAFDII